MSIAKCDQNKKERNALCLTQTLKYSFQRGLFAVGFWVRRPAPFFTVHTSFPHISQHLFHHYSVHGQHHSPGHPSSSSSITPFCLISIHLQMGLTQLLVPFFVVWFGIHAFLFLLQRFLNRPNLPTGPGNGPVRKIPCLGYYILRRRCEV